MQKYWLKKEGNRRLIVFVLGWGSDHRVVEHIRPAGYDILCTYDYRGIEPVTASEVYGYGEINIFAWSFGVWAAEQILKEVGITRAVALCGTPFPVNDRYGILPKAVAVTIKGMERKGTDEFDRRAYGSYYDKIKPFPAGRSQEDKLAELRRLAEMSQKEYLPLIKWDKAVIGEKDVIFPLENVKAYWGEKGEVRDIPHYPFANPAIVTEEL